MDGWSPNRTHPVENQSKALVFLASDDARYISGPTLDVTAGMSALFTP